MRCFIAIELPRNVRENLFNVQNDIGNDHAKIKWLAKKNLHISLKFLGDADEEKLKLTREALSNIRKKKFILELGKISWFPDEDNVKVIWIGLYPETNIFDLHGEAELKLGTLFKKDERFAVHLTLGRVKLIKNKAKFLDILRNIKIVSERFQVNSFCLIKSELTKDGPNYTILEEYALE